MLRRIFLLLTLGSLLTAALTLLPASSTAAGLPPEVEASHVGGSVHMIAGGGGNIGVLVTPAGLVMVDDLFAPDAGDIEAVLKKLSTQPLLYLINTHFHGDHTGGNAHFAGLGATLVAHGGVRSRLAAEDTSEGVALPRITHQDGLSIFVGGEEVRLIHAPKAHTDGDSLVWFPQSNVVHMGDLFFEVGYPFIDLSSGGSVDGLIAAVRQALNWIPADARIIPGHGKACGVPELREYLTMLETMRSRVKSALAAGQGYDEMIADQLTADLDERWGHFAFVPPEKFLRTLVDDLAD